MKHVKMFGKSIPIAAILVIVMISGTVAYGAVVNYLSNTVTGTATVKSPIELTLYPFSDSVAPEAYVKPLTTDGGYYLGSFSSQETEIVYQSHPDNNIYVMDADGSDPKMIYEGGTKPDWGSNGLIALGSSDGIIVIKPDGSLVEIISTSHPYGPAPNDPRYIDGVKGTDYVVWSSDCSKLAFTAKAGTDSIWTVTYEATPVLTQITDYSMTAYAPNWSPDGLEIACSWGPSTDHHVGVFHHDGSGLIRTIGTGGECPYWHENDKILYNGENFDLRVMNGDGSEDTKLVDGLTQYKAWQARWSSDYSKMLFVDREPVKNIKLLIEPKARTIKQPIVGVGGVASFTATVYGGDVFAVSGTTKSLANTPVPITSAVVISSSVNIDEGDMEFYWSPDGKTWISIPVGPSLVFDSGKVILLVGGGFVGDLVDCYSDLFPDEESTTYIVAVLHYAIDPQGSPYRVSVFAVAEGSTLTEILNIA